MARPHTALPIEVGTGAWQPLDVTPLLPIGDRFHGRRDFKLADPWVFELRFVQALA
jgi:hypothetical protein